jgi:[ribosomal protein S18]-alanine N-acetyltransferase
MEVRRATAEDTEAMAQIMAVLAEEGMVATEPPVNVAERARKFREEIESDGAGSMWVLRDSDGRIVGHGGLHEEGAAGVLTLGIGLLPEARGNGHGRRLLEAMIAAGEESDAHKIELEVWTDNQAAVAFYEDSGFQVEGVRRDHYRRRDGSLRSAIVMARMVNGADSG